MALTDRIADRARCAASAAILCAILCGCTSRTRDIAYFPSSFGKPDALPPAADLAQRKLVQGDVMTITVFELASISGDEAVDGRGVVNVPLAGPLPAEGKTLKQFSDSLTSALASKYLQSPHVTVTLKQAAQNVATVDGSVNEPGVYPVAPDATLLQMIASAKGPGKNANPKRVVIFRMIGGVREGAAFDLTTIRKGKDVDPAVYPNDLVVVDGTNLPAAYSLLLQSVRLASFAIFAF